MKPEYEPSDLQSTLGYLTEECGEVLQAAGKSLRWGLDAVNPELLREEQETNRDWLLREMRDLSGAIRRMRKYIAEHDEEDLRG